MENECSPERPPPQVGPVAHAWFSEVEDEMNVPIQSMDDFEKAENCLEDILYYT